MAICSSKSRKELMATWHVCTASILYHNEDCGGQDSSALHKRYAEARDKAEGRAKEQGKVVRL